MKSIDLNSIIDELNNYILDYTDLFQKEKIDLERQLKDIYRIDNERTLSSLSNDFLFSYFNHKYPGKMRFMANEFHIKIDDKDEIFQKSFAHEVDYKNRKDFWHNCYVDGYFKILDLHFSGWNHLFVEYKIQDKFVFADLATDFLKYKIYTSNNQIGTIFAYVIFDKNEKSPCIRSKDYKSYIMLENKILEAYIENSRIYIYVPKTDEKSVDEKPDSLILQLYCLYSDFIEFSKEFALLDQSQYKEYDDYEKTLLENAKKFNMNVYTSKLIKNNYSFFIHLWDEANIRNIFNEVMDEMGFKERNIETLIKIVDNGSTYQVLFENNLYAGKKIQAANDGLKASYYSSFNMLVLLDYFSDINGIYNIKPNYINVGIGRGKKKKIVDYNQVSQNHKAELNRIYGNPEGIKKINRLSFEILFFITSIYPLLFDIDDNGQIVDKTINEKLNKLLEKMQMKINRISKISGFKEQINLIDETKNVDDKLKRLFYFIFSKIVQIED